MDELTAAWRKMKTFSARWNVICAYDLLTLWCVVFLSLSPELVYDDVFAVWESIWAAKHVSSSHFVLFIALALVEIYRDIILENNMDFTDIIKFFNGITAKLKPHTSLYDV